MKEILKKVRNLQIYFTAMCLLLTGCSVKLEENKKSNDKEYSQSTESIGNFFANSDTPYYHRTYHSLASYDDMILTLEERGIDTLSTDAKDAIQNVSFYNGNPYNFSWVDCFDIDEYYASIYTHPNIASRVQEHTNSELYNRLTNTINWEEAVDIIVRNSKAKASNDTEEKFIALSRSDIETVLKQLEQFTKEVKKDYPDYDMAHLACQLMSLSLLYRNYSKNMNTLASTTYCSIEWYLNDSGEKPVLKTSIMLNDHEFKHLLCSYCYDEIKDGENVYITPSGVIYGANTSLNFSFIEEATAEEYSAEKNGMEVVNYYEKTAALDTLKFVLSLQDDYEEDGFLKYAFLQNPLALVQQLPVLNDQPYYFKNNLKMLASYNACFSTLPYVFVQNASSVPGYENFYQEFEKRKEVMSSLGTYASAELSRLFLTNLVVMNDTKEDMTLEYNLYLMRLFEKRMDIMFNAMSDYQKFTISSANYKQIYQERLGAFFQYLSVRYFTDLGVIRALYEEYSLSDGIIIPSFVENNKQVFYQKLESTEYDSETLKQHSDNALQYYVQYSRR